jgi:hypothetical protein
MRVADREDGVATAFAALKIVVYQSQYFERTVGWLFGAESRAAGSQQRRSAARRGQRAAPRSQRLYYAEHRGGRRHPLLFLAVLLVRPWVTIAEWLRQARVLRGASPVANMASALAAGRRALEIGDDPRAAVIACYRQCEGALASRRRGRHAAETSREFLLGALAALRLPAQPIRALLQVFERARFSNLPVTPSTANALGALDEIRTDLTGGARMAQP